MKRPSLFRSFLAPVAVLSLVVTGVACSSGGSGENPFGNSNAADKESFFRQFCDQYMPCCAKAGRPTDGAQCRTFYGSVDLGTYNAAAGSQCLSEMRAAGTSFCEGDVADTAMPSCAKVFERNGTKQPGQTCEQDNECAPSPEGNVECARLFKDGATIKKCQVQVVGKLGEGPCVATVDDNVTSYVSSSEDPDVLSKGYVCNVKSGLRCDDTTRTCVAIGKLNEPCQGFGSYLCTKDAFCDSATDTCVARKALGAGCASFSEQCVEGAYCDSTSKTCTAKLADGAPCNSSLDCKSGSCVDDKCGSGPEDLVLGLICGGG